MPSLSCCRTAAPAVLPPAPPQTSDFWPHGGSAKPSPLLQTVSLLTQQLHQNLGVLTGLAAALCSVCPVELQDPSQQQGLHAALLHVGQCHAELLKAIEMLQGLAPQLQ